MQRPRTTTRNAWIPDEDLERILDKLGAEDRCIIVLALQTGYRIDDLLRMRWGSITEPAITLQEAKTGKTRSHALTDQTRQILRDLRRLTANRQGADIFVTPTRRGRAGDNPTLSRWSIWRAFKRAVRDAGYQGRGYTVHSLRKCYAWHLYRSTLSVTAVQKDLNHDRPDTTFVYLQEPFERAARML